MSRRMLTFTVALAATVLCLSAVLLAVAASAQAGTILKGTDKHDHLQQGGQAPGRPGRFMADKLHAQLLRFDLQWATLEPQRDKFDQTYLDQLAQTIQAANGDGLKVIITIYGTPKWASDKTLWKYVPPGYTARRLSQHLPAGAGLPARLPGLCRQAGDHLQGRRAGLRVP